MKIRTLLVVISFLLTMAGAGAASAAELVMFESDSCEWCEAWHKEIGPIYPKTVESLAAPLRRVSIEEPRPADLTHVRGIHYTPTFVLVEDGKEVGRILGYPGEEFFWGLLAAELGKLDQDSQANRAGLDKQDCLKTTDKEYVDEKNSDSAAAC